MPVDKGEENVLGIRAGSHSVYKAVFYGKTNSTFFFGVSNCLFIIGVYGLYSSNFVFKILEIPFLSLSSFISNISFNLSTFDFLTNFTFYSSTVLRKLYSFLTSTSNYFTLAKLSS